MYCKYNSAKYSPIILLRVIFHKIKNLRTEKNSGSELPVTVRIMIPIREC